MSAKTETEQLLRELGDQARVVGRQDEERRKAISAERDSRAELLEAVLRSVRPALRALGTRIQLDHLDTKRAPYLGLLVGSKKGAAAGNKYVPGPVIDHLAGNPSRGRYTGFDLFLTEDAKLVEVRYDGPWAKDAAGSWDAEVYDMTPRRAVEDGYDVPDILDEIEKALVSQLDGAATKKTDRAWMTAQRLHALSLLARAL